MIFSINYTNQFKKDYKRYKKRGMDIARLKSVVKDLRTGKRLNQKYKDHKLNGKYSGFHECHVRSDLLLIYFHEKVTKTLTLVRLGSHSDLFE